MKNLVPFIMVSLFSVAVQAQQADQRSDATAQEVKSPGIAANAESPTDQVNPDAHSSSMKAQIPSSTQRADIDQEITNARLRASTGAKSLISVQSTVNYNGASIQDPFGQLRPQLSPGVIENDPSKITGTVSIKYRASDHDNINVGIGYGWVTPGYQGQYGQSEDPYVAYGRLFKWGNVQNVLNVQMLKYTADSSIANQLNYESDIDHTFLLPVGNGKLQFGVDIGWTREFYYQFTGGIQDELFAYPFSEYELNKTFSLRTVYRGVTFYNTSSATGTFTRDDVTQSLGVGISVARDVYLYPNLQWVWTDLSSQKTNVALSANINM